MKNNFKIGVSKCLIILIVAAIGLAAALLYLQILENKRIKEREASEVAQRAREEEKLAQDKKEETKPPATPPETSATSTPETPPESDEPKFTGIVLAGTTSVLLDFNQADYEAALRSNKLVVLYFYATWCPICAAELPHLYGAFNELTGDKVVGFRVNFNDGDTDSDERNLARDYGVAYQHTKVFIKNGRRVLKSPETWEKARYLAEIIKFIE